MPSFAACSTAAGTRSTESRSTPGMEATGVRAFAPAEMKIGQMKSSAESLVSATRRRTASALRLRRMRTVG